MSTVQASTVVEKFYYRGRLYVRCVDRLGLYGPWRSVVLGGEQ